MGSLSQTGKYLSCYRWCCIYELSRAFERQEPSSERWSDESKPRIIKRLDALTDEVRNSLEKQGFKGDRVRVERLLNMRFDGTDTSLMALEPDDGSSDFEKTFKAAYKQEFGFLLESKNIIIDDIKVRTTLRFAMSGNTLTGTTT